MAIAAVLVLSACTGDGERVVDGSEVIVASSEPFTSYNDRTAFGNTAANNAIVAATNSSFSYFDDDRELVADESFGHYEVVSDSPFSVRYTLASGVSWSDGTPIDAADLLLSWAANSGAFTSEGFSPADYIDQETGEFTADFPSDAVYFDGATHSGLERVHATPVVSSDRRSITLTYGEYFADWKLAFEIGVPAHVVGERALDLDAEGSEQAAKDAVVAAITDHDNTALAAISRTWNSDFNFDRMPTDDALLVGSGPYTVTAIEPGESVTLTANAAYRGIRKPTVETVVIRTISDPLMAVDALEAGEVDVITPAPTTAVLSALEAVEGVTTDVGSSGTFEHLDLQFDGGKSDIFGDSLVRRAFLATVPRERIVTELVASIDPSATVRSSFVLAPASEGYADAIERNGSSAADEVDIAEAKNLLAQAGVEKPRVCVLYDPANPRRVAEFTLIRESAALAGFVVTDCSDPGWMELLGVGGAYDAALFGWNESIPAVTGLQSRLGSTSTVSNFSNYSSATVDELLATLAKTGNVEEQHEVLVQIDTALWTHAYGMPLYQYPAVTAWSDRVSNVSPSALAPGVFWNIWDWQPAAKGPSPAPSR